MSKSILGTCIPRENAREVIAASGEHVSAICSLQNERWLNRDARRTCTSYVCARAEMCALHVCTCTKSVLERAENIDHSGWRMVAFGVLADEGGRGERGGGYQPRDGNVRMKDRVWPGTRGRDRVQELWEGGASLSLSLPRRRNLGMSWRLLPRSR